MAKIKNRGQTMLESMRNDSTSQHDNEAETIPQTPEALIGRNGNTSTGPNRSQFMSYLGKLARNGIRLPLTYVTFSQVHEDFVDYIWTEVQDNTNSSPAYKNNCLKSVAEKWRNWKNRVKSTYISGKPKEECLAMVPKEVEVDQWKVLVEYWSTEKVKEAAEREQAKSSISGMAAAGKCTDNVSVWIEMRTDATGNPKDDATAAIIEEFNEALADVPLDEQELEELRYRIFEDRRGMDMVVYEQWG
ncbi:Plant transposase [Abeliophyllum distichum]|uniref:Plant transposase n=1 Tax=Abeliophyllum distichum TaxID=126358 RepID=A0ABD1RVZ6_9LAMI